MRRPRPAPSELIPTACAGSTRAAASRRRSGRRRGSGCGPAARPAARAGSRALLQPLAHVERLQQLDSRTGRSCPRRREAGPGSCRRSCRRNPAGPTETTRGEPCDGPGSGWLGVAGAATAASPTSRSSTSSSISGALGAEACRGGLHRGLDLGFLGQRRRLGLVRLDRRRGRDLRPSRCALPITALRDTPPSSSAIWLAVRRLPTSSSGWRYVRRSSSFGFHPFVRRVRPALARTPGR